jgi:hypothetical protein
MTEIETIIKLCSDSIKEEVDNSLLARISFENDIFVYTKIIRCVKKGETNEHPYFITKRLEIPKEYTEQLKKYLIKREIKK